MKSTEVNVSTLKGVKKAERMHKSGKYEAPFMKPGYADILIFSPKIKRLSDGLHGIYKGRVIAI